MSTDESGGFYRSQDFRKLPIEQQSIKIPVDRERQYIINERGGNHALTIMEMTSEPFTVRVAVSSPPQANSQVYTLTTKSPLLHLGSKYLLVVPATSSEDAITFSVFDHDPLDEPPRSDLRGIE